MGSVEGSTLLPKIATILLALALLFHLIAISAPWWSVSNTQKTERYEHVGLWRYCTSPIGDLYESCWDFVDIITGGMCTLHSTSIIELTKRDQLPFLQESCGRWRKNEASTWYHISMYGVGALSSIYYLLLSVGLQNSQEGHIL